MKKDTDPKEDRNGESTETRLRKSIQRELMRCDSSVTPALCSRTSTLDGYRMVEETIISMVIKQGLMPSACIGLLESEWSTN